MNNNWLFLSRKQSVIIVLCFTILFSLSPFNVVKAAEIITPKILIVTMFQLGDPLDPKSAGEATIWVQTHQLNKTIPIVGSKSPLYCNEKKEMCLVTTGVGTTNAAMTMMALGLSEQLDLSKTYIIIAGIAGVSPNVASVESVAIADWFVDVSVSGEYDAREMPSTFKYPRFPYGCSSNDCKEPFRMGTESSALNLQMVEWALNLTKDIKLEQSETGKQKGSSYTQKTARSFPKVVKCTVAGGNTFWHGKLISDWVSSWVDKVTQGKSHYCMTSVEEPGLIPVIDSLTKSGRYDIKRTLLLRVSSNFDQQTPNQNVEESFTKALMEVNQAVGMHNLHLVGWSVAEYILKNWKEWEKGVPTLP